MNSPISPTAPLLRAAMTVCGATPLIRTFENPATPPPPPSRKTAAGESPLVPKFYQTISSRSGVEGKVMNIEERTLTFSRAALLGRPC
ncbi:hypothetical protein TNCT_636401 [Trichonephila clavata]|uniref:Uncharacterized protein n=1 Tax=Trichonephila clavata TaxID=2740835 RepID=A0A8X6F0R0_TRICU|nr:hypothetical protein TNCT_636401 [Trichonephila clavata]